MTALGPGYVVKEQRWLAATATLGKTASVRESSPQLPHIHTGARASWHLGHSQTAGASVIFPQSNHLRERKMEEIKLVSCLKSSKTSTANLVPSTCINGAKLLAPGSKVTEASSHPPQGSHSRVGNGFFKIRPNSELAHRRASRAFWEREVGLY